MSKRCFSPIHAGIPGPVRVALAASCLWALSSLSAPENYLIDTWRFDDDLPRDGIISVAQGKDGYLWVSSRYGLARFDGVRFVRPGSLAGAQFLGHHYASLSRGRSGAVWVGTPGGGLLEWRDGRLLPCMQAANPLFGPVVAGLTNAQGRDLAMAPDGRVLGWSNGLAELVLAANRWGAPVPASVCQDKQGNIWFVTYQHKLVRVEGTNAQEMVYGLGDNRRNWIALQADTAGDVWAGTQREVGVWRGHDFKPIASPVEAFPVDDLIAVPPAVHNDTTSSGSGIEVGGGRLWVVALGRAWLLEGNRWMTNVLFEPSAGLYETSPRLADQAANLWFTATKASIVRAGADGGLMVLTEQDGLPSGQVAALYEDREGSIWAGIEHAGLARLRERYFTRMGWREGTKAPLVWAVVEDPAGAVWLGTEHSGLHRWQEGKFTQFHLGNGGLPGSVYSLCLDQEGTLWAGTGDDGVFRFENGRFVPVWEYPGPGWNKRVYVIYEDHLGQMWFGTGLGLFCWQAGKVRHCLGKGFEPGVVRAIAEDPTGRLWVGMSGGGETHLACLEGDGLVRQGMEDGLLGHDIFGLHAGGDGSLWIGTVGDGLWRRRNGELSHYTTEEGLPDDRIYSIAEDGSGHLWLGSPAGIFRLDLRSMTALDAGQTNRLDCLAYNRTDGLPTRECAGGSQPSIYSGRNGRLLFAMTEGAVALAPGEIRVNGLPPPVLIEEVRVDGRPLDIQPEAPFDLHAAGLAPSRQRQVPLAIGPGRHVVEFYYTATSLIAPAKVRFQCRLDGVDAQWRQVGGSRSIMYSLTSPGDYRFHVSACNNDGVWNQAGTAIALTIAPYIWQTWWCRAGALLLILLTVAGSIRFLERRKVQRQLERLERQQMIEQERARIARDIHDELGASLTEIGLLSEFARRESAPAEQVRDDVEKIAAKTRSSARALDEIVWAVNPRNDTIESFATYACACAQEQLQLAGIRCRFDAASPLPRRPLRAETRHHLFMALKEALNNVVKHARASQVDISISADSDRLTVGIRDNGCGFIYDAACASGNGLANMKARLESVGGRFACESAPGRGTRITLTMKLA